MTPQFKEVSVPKDLNDIPVSPRLADLIRQGEAKEWENLFGYIRLSLANRIGSATEPDLLTLQGKVKGVEEISSFFQKIISKKA